MGRIRDAWTTLLHGTPRSEVALMRAEWVELMVEVTSVLEQLNAWAARQAKRESREAKRQLSAPPQEAIVVPPGDVKQRKAALRARLRSGGALGAPRRRDLSPGNGLPLEETGS